MIGFSPTELARSLWRFAKWMLIVAWWFVAFWMGTMWGPWPAVLVLSHGLTFLVGGYVVPLRRLRIAEETNHYLDEEVQAIKVRDAREDPHHVPIRARVYDPDTDLWGDPTFGTWGAGAAGVDPRSRP